MLDIVRQVEFRAFSYEDDPESLVDLHRCMETLEGGWFDAVATCRMHSKIVARTPGSSWVLVVAGTVLGHAHMLNNHDGTAMISRWRIHPDFRIPELAKALLDGLCREARHRSWEGLLLLADAEDVCRDLESAGLRRDRAYRWLQIDDAEPDQEAAILPFTRSVREFSPNPLLRYLGSPYPADYVLNQALMASEYGVFNFIRPSLFTISWQGNDYLACYDGREWFVFRKEPRDSDLAAVRPIMKALAGIGNGRMMVNEKALEASGMLPVSANAMFDFFHPL